MTKTRKPRTICPVCEREVVQRKDGSPAGHRPPSGGPVNCPGGSPFISPMVPCPQCDGAGGFAPNGVPATMYPHPRHVLHPALATLGRRGL